MEPMGLSAYALAKALRFPEIYDVVPGNGRSVRMHNSAGKYFGVPAQFWLNLQFDYENRGEQRCGQDPPDLEPLPPPGP